MFLDKQQMVQSLRPLRPVEYKIKFLKMLISSISLLGLRVKFYTLLLVYLISEILCIRSIIKDLSVLSQFVNHMCFFESIVLENVRVL